jgi:guanidinopropionase
MSMLPEFEDPMARPRYTGLATFMRAPYREEFDGIDIGVIGVPFDGGVTNRPGARHGPREIRNQSSLMRKINQASGVAPFELCQIADLGDAWVQRPFHLESSLDEIASFYRGVHAAQIVPLSAGGDHSISLPILRAISKRHGPVGLVHFDSHTDCWDQYFGSKYFHGTMFRRAVEEGVIDPRRTIQLGIRGPLYEATDFDFQAEHGMQVITIDEFKDQGLAWTTGQLQRLASGGKVYVTFDIDSVDPAFAPATGTPEVGGLTSHDALRLVRSLRGLDIVGFDLVEVSPQFDGPGQITALLAANLLFEFLCLIAAARAPAR